MASRAVSGFQPSVNGFHFANRWPTEPAFRWSVGYLHLGLGNAARGLCGGMSFAVRDRFERGEAPPPASEVPAAATPLLDEIVRRQVDSFDRLVVGPFRFWWMAAQGELDRQRATVRDAWPRIRADIDAGRLAMIGLVRAAGPNPLQIGLGHQVVGFRYDESVAAVRIGIYDPNHPDDDTIELALTRAAVGGISLSQSSGEPLVGLLALPYVPPR